MLRNFTIFMLSVMLGGYAMAAEADIANSIPSYFSEPGSPEFEYIRPNMVELPREIASKSPTRIALDFRNFDKNLILPGFAYLDQNNIEKHVIPILPAATLRHLISGSAAAVSEFVSELPVQRLGVSATLPGDNEFDLTIRPRLISIFVKRQKPQSTRKAVIVRIILLLKFYSSEGEYRAYELLVSTAFRTFHWTERHPTPVPAIVDALNRLGEKIAEILPRTKPSWSLGTL